TCTIGNSTTAIFYSNTKLQNVYDSSKGNRYTDDL
ncbi:MAG: hypothetical protein ACI9FN_000878, partial [Saprospiraceae bacterium]